MVGERQDQIGQASLKVILRVDAGFNHSNGYNQQ